MGCVLTLGTVLRKNMSLLVLMGFYGLVFQAGLCQLARTPYVMANSVCIMDCWWMLQHHSVKQILSERLHRIPLWWHIFCLSSYRTHSAGSILRGSLGIFYVQMLFLRLSYGILAPLSEVDPDREEREPCSGLCIIVEYATILLRHVALMRGSCKL